MGSDKDSDNEKRQETIPYHYWIAKYPITYAQYKMFFDDTNGYHNVQWWNGLHTDGLTQQKQGTGDQHWKIANCPAENVSWYDAMAFCAWLNARLTLEPALRSQGYSFRLPTDSEWEKAARGTDGREYPYSGEFDPTKGNTDEAGIGQTSAVGVFPDGASPYGVTDMSGNVWEWTLTEYQANPSSNSGNGIRISHGGSWFDWHFLVRSAYRNILDPIERFNYNGFRLVLVPQSF